MSWSEVLNELTTYLLMGGIVLVIMFIVQVVKNRDLFNDSATTHICDKCNAKKLDDGKYVCECGGEFVHINKMKWVEEE
ncbi:MAG: hypothetical protein JXR53_11230 [Bacteroidales bacterium]|nr:hypothetical protein [Bacteroidales bacterium]